MPDFRAHELANTLRPTAKTSKRMPAVFTALCEAKAEDVLGLHTHELANTLRDMAKTNKHMPAVFTALCEAKAEDVLDFNARELANALRPTAKTSKHIYARQRLWMCATSTRTSSPTLSVVFTTLGEAKVEDMLKFEAIEDVRGFHVHELAVTLSCVYGPPPGKGQ